MYMYMSAARWHDPRVPPSMPYAGFARAHPCQTLMPVCVRVMQVARSSRTSRAFFAAAGRGG